MSAIIRAAWEDENKLSKIFGLFFTSGSFALCLFCVLIFSLLMVNRASKLLLSGQQQSQVQQQPTAPPTTNAPPSPITPAAPPPAPKKQEVPKEFKEFLNY
jgi:hypothetical protein